ncbi:hypothetical protein PRUPE_7G151600 [Prunus persica]|uniref:DNA-directed RNA polymerase III subunit RPC5 n=1 Tax=Prunus persica TaxID=3760 RepID=M5VPF7_PRUPE|nr:DNA-directed RNA polymerase III subunit RPC5 [Prunus persica]ONH96780.1 hypothetical protein PRUPE_7G151600 [Prunus persica]
MDLDDFDKPSQVAARPSRFVPRSSKAKPKPKSEPVVKQEPPKPVTEPEPEKPELKPKPEELDALIAEKEEEEGTDGAPKNEDSNGGLKMETDEEPKEDDPMEEDDVEDTIVREIDVFFNPHIDDNSQLYVLQYPLRPWWRPYELENRCEEVRLKPATSEMEIDLSLNLDPKNYDEDCGNRLKMTKQTLYTTWKPTRTTGTGYAVGVLMGDKLHLNPIDKVVQLRPSLEHLKSGSSRRKNSVTGDAEVKVKLEESRQETSSGPSKKQTKRMESSTEKKTEDEESWVPLQYHSSESDFSAKYLRRMVGQESSPIQFTMSPYDYVNSLCPRTCKGSSRRFLLSLPLEERIKKLLVEEPLARRFSDLKKYFAPDHTGEELLDVLQKHAQLLLDSGLWVPKTLLLYPSKDMKDRDHVARQTARNYVLNLFRKNTVISNSQLNLPQNHKNHAYESLKILAVSRPSSQDWKLKEQSDKSFKELYPDIFKSQEQNWERMEEKLVNAFKAHTDRGVKNACMTSKPGKSLNSDKGTTKSASDVQIGGRTMSDETRAALPEAIKEVLHEHKVCNFRLICEGLRRLAVRKSSLPKVDPKTKRVIDAAYGVDAPQHELQKVICQVAADIHGLYVLKSSPEHSEHDRLRKVVIDLLCTKGPNAKLKRGEVFEAAKIALERDINTNEYNKVMNDFCVFKGSAWILKSGDGGPN